MEGADSRRSGHEEAQRHGGETRSPLHCRRPPQPPAGEGQRRDPSGRVSPRAPALSRGRARTAGPKPSRVGTTANGGFRRAGTPEHPGGTHFGVESGATLPSRGPRGPGNRGPPVGSHGGRHVTEGVPPGSAGGRGEELGGCSRAAPRSAPARGPPHAAPPLTCLPDLPGSGARHRPPDQAPTGRR
jgi:hypothetical protein